jgi:hypothetical protein
MYAQAAPRNAPSRFNASVNPLHYVAPVQSSADDRIWTDVESRLQALDREVRGRYERPNELPGHINSTSLRQPRPPLATGGSQLPRRASTSTVAPSNLERNGRHDQDTPPANTVTRHELYRQEAARRREQWTPSPLGHLNHVSSLDQRLRSMPSGISMFSADLTVETSSTLSVTPDQSALSVRHGRLRRIQGGLHVRHILSTTFSDGDDDQSEMSELSNLGRRRWESTDLG